MPITQDRILSLITIIDEIREKETTVKKIAGIVNTGLQETTTPDYRSAYYTLYNAINDFETLSRENLETFVIEKTHFKKYFKHNVQNREAQKIRRRNVKNTSSTDADLLNTIAAIATVGAGIPEQSSLLTVASEPLTPATHPENTTLNTISVKEKQILAADAAISTAAKKGQIF